MVTNLAELGTWVRRHLGNRREALRVGNKDQGGGDVDHELEDDPVVTEQAPRSSKGLDQPVSSEATARGTSTIHAAGSMTGRRPGPFRRHRSSRRRPPAEEGGDGAQPADGETHVGEQRGLAHTWQQLHGSGDEPAGGPVCVPESPPEGDDRPWSPGAPPKSSNVPRMRTRATVNATETFTQRGAPPAAIVRAVFRTRHMSSRNVLKNDRLRPCRSCGTRPSGPPSGGADALSPRLPACRQAGARP